jgi:hypothetical protein
VGEIETWRFVWHLTSSYNTLRSVASETSRPASTFLRQLLLWESEADESCFTTTYKQNQNENSGLLWCDTVFWFEWCHMLQNTMSVLLGLLDTRKCRYYVRLKLQISSAQWRCVTSNKCCIITLIDVRFESLTTNILAKVNLSTSKSKLIWIRTWRIYTLKMSVFLNPYKPLANASVITLNCF